LANSITVQGVRAGYGAVQVLEGISLRVNDGETVALLGTNGNGKSTLLKAIMGIVRPTAGRIVAEVDGRSHDLVGLEPEQVVNLGIGLVPEGRRLFPKLTVHENLLLGASRPAARGRIAENLKFCLDVFPVLAERRNQLAGSLSGGEQQMLALGRALMSHPRLLLLDEPSLGLAPMIVREFFRIVRELNEKEGLTVLVVEQDARIALTASSRAYVLEVGRVALAGASSELRDDESVRRSYLGY